VFLVIERCFSFSMYVCMYVCLCTHTHIYIHIPMYIRIGDLVVELERFGRSGKHIRHVV